MLQQVFAAMGHKDEMDRQREFYAAVTRIQPFAQSMRKAKDQALLLASPFMVRRQQKTVYATVQSIMAAVNHVTSWESTLLSELRLAFRL